MSSWGTLGGLNAAWAAAVIEELAAAGVSQVVVSPGFRNSPLILAAHKSTAVQSFSVLDERSAAFFALGLAKRSRKPAAVICTSGTACANFFPAILEARYSQIPLIIITADRPQELVGLGANQTMDQHNLFGASVKKYSYLAAPNLAKADFDHLRYTVAKTIAAADLAPVHLNIAFDEPLLPQASEKVASAPGNRRDVFIPKRVPAREQVVHVTKLLREKQRKLAVVGPGSYSPEFVKDLFKFCEALAIPLIAEPSSGISFGPHTLESTCLISQPKAFYALPAQETAVDLVLRFGPPPISKKLLGALNALENIPVLLFDEAGEMRDPAQAQGIYLDGAVDAWVQALRQEFSTPEPQPQNLLKTLRAKNTEISKTALEEAAQAKDFSEKQTIVSLLKWIPNSSTIFLGNSLPVREFNALAAPSEKRLQIFHNRGLSGIDGLIATASGTLVNTAQAGALLIGDLSCIHDIGSLALVKNLSAKLSLKIFVINNQGGGIFRTLSIGDSPEEWLTTPQEMNFSAAATAFGLPYARLEKVSQLDSEMQKIFSRLGPELIEVVLCPQN